MEYEHPITILSDLHLGHPVSYVRAAEQLAPLFRDAATVVFNGDTAEMLWLKHRRKAQKNIKTITRLCREEGARPIFINGNHDPMVSNLNHVELCGGAVLVTHGDILFHKLAPWGREAEIMGEVHTRILRELGVEALRDFEQRLIATKRTMIAILKHNSPLFQPAVRNRLAKIIQELIPPKRFLKLIKCWVETPERAARLGKKFRPEAGFVIIGHTHRAGWWRKGQRVVMNTGSFMPFSGRSAVQIDNKFLTYRKIERRKGCFELGRVVARFEVCKLPVVQKSLQNEFHEWEQEAEVYV